MKKNWYAVYTKPHCEKKVTALLSKKKIENYCPLNRIVNSQGNKKSVVYEPLFPTFVFVYATDSEITVIRQTGFIINFVYWLGKPVVITDVEIENIQNFANLYSNIQLEKTNVNANGMVRFISEPHLDVSNNLPSVENSNCRLLIPSLGYVMMTTIETSTYKVHDSLNDKKRYLVSNWFF